MDNDLLILTLKEERLKLTQVIDLLQLYRERGFHLQRLPKKSIYLTPFKYCFYDENIIRFVYDTHQSIVVIKEIEKIVVENNVPTIYLKEYEKQHKENK